MIERPLIGCGSEAGVKMWREKKNYERKICSTGLKSWTPIEFGVRDYIQVIVPQHVSFKDTRGSWRCEMDSGGTCPKSWEHTRNDPWRHTQGVWCVGQWTGRSQQTVWWRSVCLLTVRFVGYINVHDRDGCWWKQGREENMQVFVRDMNDVDDYCGSSDNTVLRYIIIRIRVNERLQQPVRRVQWWFNEIEGEKRQEERMRQWFRVQDRTWRELSFSPCLPLQEVGKEEEGREPGKGGRGEERVTGSLSEVVKYSPEEEWHDDVRLVADERCFRHNFTVMICIHRWSGINTN